jgi:aminopeptidase N
VVGGWASREDPLRVVLGREQFPCSAAGPELLQRIDEFLAQPDLDPALRRVVIEGRDVVAKALRSRLLPD